MRLMGSISDKASTSASATFRSRSLAVPKILTLVINTVEAIARYPAIIAVICPAKQTTRITTNAVASMALWRSGR